jgi:hypothetical protein
MFSLLHKLLQFFILIAILAFLVRNDLPRWLMERWVHEATGQTLAIEATSFSNLQPARIKGFDYALENPFRFPAGNALKGSRFEILFPRTFWYGFSFQIERLTLQIDEVAFVRDESGQLNLALRPAAVRAPNGRGNGAQDTPPLVRDLFLSIGRVSFVDYAGKSGGKQPIMTEINLKELHLHDVADLRQLEEVIVREAITRAHLKGLEKN